MKGRLGIVTLLGRLVLAGVFLSAALPKIADPEAFRASVDAFRVIGSNLSGWVALLLPWLELVVGFGLLLPLLRRACDLIVAALLVGFIGLHGSAWARGLDISCGCFGDGSGEGSNYALLIARNTLLLGAAIWVTRADFKADQTAETRTE